MNTSEPLSLREKFAYGFGDLASVLYWQTFMVYLTFFYTDVFGLAAGVAGTMILLSRGSDAFFDPIMGMIADRTQTRWGKFRPFLLWFCVPFAAMGVLTFTVPNFGANGKLVWAYATYNGLMLLYTAINIPYTAMLGVLSSDANERTALSSIKFVGAFLAGILVSAMLLPMAKIFGHGNAARGWQVSFVLIGLAAILFFLIVFFNTRERVTPPASQHDPVVRNRGAELARYWPWLLGIEIIFCALFAFVLPWGLAVAVPLATLITVLIFLINDTWELVTNGPWLVLLATTITFILFVALRGSVTIHYFKYYVGQQTVPLPSFLGGTKVWDFVGLASAFNTVNQLASLAGVMLVPFFARITGRKLAFVILFVIAIASTASFYFFRPDQLLLIFGVNILGSLTGGPLSALLWAMYADTADYAEWKKGRRATGLVFSASIFSQKQGWAIGAWVALTLMQSVGFVANTAQTPASLHALVKLMSIFPAAFGVVSVVIVFFYPLTEKRMAQIAADLKARRGGETAAVTA